MVETNRQGSRWTGSDGRPSRADIDPAALALIARYGSTILATARRYAATAEDAEDAYQRGLEILLTKAPTTDENELVPWLKTVVKHEAFALQRQRRRNGGALDDDELERSEAPLLTEDQAERLERLRLGAEAMGRLKPQEVRCLLLLAEGYSYKQICEETGWTYTKVNRCITEGRRAFLRQVADIEAGNECDRLSPMLSALADGHATSEQMLRLRPHLRGCLACRATLRDYRETPVQVAALVPPVALITEPLVDAVGGSTNQIAKLVEQISCWANERVLLVGMKSQGLLDAVTAQKVAAVAASTAALAGGGAASMQLAPDQANVRPRPKVVAKQIEPRQGEQKTPRQPLGRIQDADKESTREGSRRSAGRTPPRPRPSSDPKPRSRKAGGGGQTIRRETVGATDTPPTSEDFRAEASAALSRDSVVAPTPTPTEGSESSEFGFESSSPPPSSQGFGSSSPPPSSQGFASSSPPPPADTSASSAEFAGP